MTHALIPLLLGFGVNTAAPMAAPPVDVTPATVFAFEIDGDAPSPNALPETIALAAGPDIDKSCNGYPVLTARHVAAQYAGLARDKLSSLNKLSNEARKNAWRGSTEEKWLGRYSRKRFDVARSVMTAAASVLNSSNLTIECDTSYKNWAKTYSSKYVGGLELYTIVLGNPWLLGAKDISAAQLAGERQQTLVHEAAHHGGANRGEFLGRSGVAPALKRAKRHPAIAARTAENHGYYAICRASASAACQP